MRIISELVEKVCCHDVSFSLIWISFINSVSFVRFISFVSSIVFSYKFDNPYNFYKSLTLADSRDAFQFWKLAFYCAKVSMSQQSYRESAPGQSLRQSDQFPTKDLR